MVLDMVTIWMDFEGGVLNREATTLGRTMLDPNGFLDGEISVGY